MVATQCGILAERVIQWKVSEQLNVVLSRKYTMIIGVYFPPVSIFSLYGTFYDRKIRKIPLGVAILYAMTKRRILKKYGCDTRWNSRRKISTNRIRNSALIFLSYVLSLRTGLRRQVEVTAFFVSFFVCLFV